MAARPQGFRRGDLDTAFPLDDKFTALRTATDETTYYAATGVFFHLVAETWRSAQRIALRRVLPGAPEPVVEALRAARLISSDGRLPKATFQRWIGAAIARRATNTDRQRRRRTDDDGTEVDSGLGMESNESQFPRSVSRVTTSLSGQDTLRTGTGSGQVTEGGDVARARGRRSADERSVLVVACPECGAVAGEPCQGVRPARNGQVWQRWSVHRPRWLVATADPTELVGADAVTAWLAAERQTHLRPGSTMAAELDELIRRKGDRAVLGALERSEPGHDGRWYVAWLMRELDPFPTSRPNGGHRRGHTRSEEEIRRAGL